MDEPERRTLTSSKKYLCDNLIFETTILDHLVQVELFTDDLAQKVKKKRTNAAKIDKFLYILVRKSPNAFQEFLSALQSMPGNEHVVNQLTDEYQRQVQILNANRKGSKSETSSNSKMSLSSAESMDSISSDTEGAPGGSKQQQVASTTEAQRDISNPKKIDTTNKGHSYRRNSNHTNCSSNSDNRHGQINQRGPNNSQSNNAYIDSDNSHSHSIHQKFDHMSTHFMPGTQEWLDGLYTKLRANLNRFNIREHTFQSKDSFNPEPVSFAMVDAYVDELLKTFDDCYSALNDKDRKADILTHIHELKKVRKDLQNQLHEMELSKNKSSNYAVKLENKCRTMQTEINGLQAEKQKLVSEMFSLKETMQKVQEGLENVRADCAQKNENLKTANFNIEKLMEELHAKDEEIKALKEKNQRKYSNHRHGGERLKLMGRTPQSHTSSFQDMTVSTHSMSNEPKSPTRQRMESPKKEIDSPRLETGSPVRQMDSPRQKRASTIRKMDSPRKNFTTPSQDQFSLRKSYESSDKLDVSPTGMFETNNKSRRNHGFKPNTTAKEIDPLNTDLTKHNSQFQSTENYGSNDGKLGLMISSQKSEVPKQREPKENSRKLEVPSPSVFMKQNGQNRQNRFHRQLSTQSKPQALDSLGIFMTKPK